MNIIKRIIEIIKDLLIIILVFILMNVVYSKFILKEYPTKLFGNALLIVTTGSMEPTIKSGELIIIREKEKYEIGDIVTYKDNEGFLITHRIVKKDNKHIITKGDANNVNDEKSTLEKIEGKVIYHSKILGKFVLYWLKPLVFVYVVIILIITLLKNSFKKEERSTKNESQKENEENKNIGIN